MQATQPENLQIPFYLPIGKEVEIFEKAYENRIPILLKGPTGSGKSRFIEFMAHKMGKTMLTVNCHEETSATDLIGRFLIKGAETIWMDGPLTKAVKEGNLLYLDEVAEARPDVIVAIHSLTDHRRELFIDKLGITLKAHPEFLLIASFNPGYQRGFKELKPSTRQRFSALFFSYPQPELESKILQSEAGINAVYADKLVQIGQKIRSLKEIGLTETVSTRLLVNAGKLIHSGLGPRISVRIAIVEPLTDEQETIAALTDLCNLLI